MVEQYQHPELRNIAADLDEDELERIAMDCLEDFENDLDSRSDWATEHSKWLRLYFQKDVPESPPWQGASEESIPILAEAANQFHARAYQAMFPNRRIIRAIPVGKTDAHALDRADRVSTHMTWQLLHKDRGYKRRKDRLLHALPVHGSVFTKVWSDGRMNHTRNVRAIDLVVPYGTGPRDIEDLDRKSEIIYTTVHRTKLLEQSGFFVAAAEPIQESEKSPVDEAHDDVEGYAEPVYKRGDCKLIEQHCVLDLDNDGIAEPYIVTIDTVSKKVLRIAIRWDTDEMGRPTDEKRPVEYYTHYVAIENPDGFYGLGFGHLLGPINTAVNKLLRQTIDAATLANVGNASGFIDKMLATRKGTVEFQLGKFIPTEMPTDDLRRHIFQFQFPGPNQALLQAIELLMGRGDRLASVTEAITGQTEKVIQPQALTSLIEQSLQQFSAVYERVVDSWTRELEKYYRLNYKHMDPEEYFSVLDVDGALRSFSSGREDYAPDMQVQPIADPRMTTRQQKLEKAQLEFQISQMNPLIMNSPPHIYQMFRRVYQAMEVDDIEQIMPPVLSQGLPRMDDPNQENVGALSDIPAVPMAYPDQDHMAHLETHMALMEDPEQRQNLSSMGRMVLEEHIRSHLRWMYGANAGMAGQVGAGTMAPAPGDQGIPPGPGGEVPDGGLAPMPGSPDSGDIPGALGGNGMGAGLV